jgi:hypothetical protein
MFGWFTPQPRKTKLWVRVVKWSFDWEEEPDSQVWVCIERVDGNQSERLKFFDHHKWKRRTTGVTHELPEGEYRLFLTPFWLRGEDKGAGKSRTFRLHFRGQAVCHIEMAFHRDRVQVFQRWEG